MRSKVPKEGTMAHQLCSWPTKGTAVAHTSTEHVTGVSLLFQGKH